MEAILYDPSVYPTDDVIFSHIAENKVHWQRFHTGVRQAYPGSEGIWRFYNDGKSWLFRFMLKKKTLCWIGLFENTFRITFYFSDKAQALIETGDLPETLKENFRNGKYYGKIKAITILVKAESDVDNALSLAGIRVRVA
jgi:hypothetical protein